MKMETLGKTIKKTGSAVVEETIEVSKITTGRIAYNNAKVLLKPIMPRIKWYEKLFTDGKRRELTEMLIVYTAVHMFKHKFDNYATDAITKYINYELQDKFLGSMTGNIDFNNLFGISEKKK